MNTPTPRITYAMEEAMDALRISRATIYDLVNNGKLRTYKIGRRRFCTHDAIIQCQHALEEEAQRSATA